MPPPHPAASARRALLLCAALLLPAAALPAATYVIQAAADFASLPATLQAGDTVLVMNGTYANVQRTIAAAGTVENPVRFRAENPGQVFFSGSTRFTFNGSGMIISGFVFDGDVAPGGVNGSALFRFNLNSSDMVLRDVVVNNYDSGTAAGGAFYVLVNGYRHTIEYCRFSRKDSQDPVINIIPQEDEGAPAGTFPTRDVPRLHRIRYCYFGERTNIGENEYETIRIGESRYQMYRLATVVEYCVFERAIYGPDITNYEPEVISSKSRGNIYRHNTLIDCKGGIVLRHGDDCVVEGNFIFAEPGSAMGAGIRIIGMRHLIRNNYIQDVAGTGLRSPIVVMKGTGEFADDSTSNGYELPSFARIFHNTIVNGHEALQLGGTTSTSGTNIPRGVELRGNVIVGATGNGPVLNLNGAPVTAFAFENNFAHHPAGLYGDTLPAAGLSTGEPLLHAHDAVLGYTIPQPGSPVLGQAPATTPPTLRDLRGLTRASPADAGAFDTQATGTVLNRPLGRNDVGPSYDGRNSTAMAPLIVASPASQQVLEYGTAVFTVLVSGDEPPSYQWYRDELPIPGATAASHTIPSVELTDAGSYTVAVTNPAGTAFTVPATLAVTPVRPAITAQPGSQFRAVGGTASFSVSASGQEPFTYVWTRDGTVIPGANDATLTLNNLQPADAGSYRVEVVNSYGSVLSAAAILSLPAAHETIVVNDTFADGERGTQQPPDSLQWFGSTSGALSVASGAMTLALPTGGRHAQASFGPRTLAPGETLTFYFDFTLGSTPSGISGGLRLGLFDSEPSATKLQSESNGNVTYAGYGVFTNLNPVSANPTLLRKRGTTAAAQLITSQTAYADVAGGGPVVALAADTPYRATLRLERTLAGAVNLTLHYTGGALDAYEIQGADATDPVWRFDTLAIAVGSQDNQAATSSLRIANVTVLHGASLVPTPPAISTPPSPFSGNVGGNAQFSVVATGTGPLSYQWHHNGSPIEGATGPTLNLTQLQESDAGDYTVTVSNDLGSVTSNPVVLTVTAALVAPTITAQPVSLTRAPGESAAFSVTANGSTPLSYQWRRNGADIPGAIVASLNLASVQPADAGDYTCVVTNAAGSATSLAATLLVTGAAGQPVQLVAETFADGNRTGQNPPSSLAWFCSASATNATVADGRLILQTGGTSSRHLVAYFDPQTLAIGDTLELRCDFILGGTVANINGGFRLALLNAAGATKLQADNSNPSTVTFVGYGAFATPAPTGANPLTLRERPATAATLITGSSYVTFASGGGSSVGFAAETPYQARLTLVRVDEERMSITATYTGGTLDAHTVAGEDTTGIVSTFDTIAFGLSNASNVAAATTLTLDNITVTHTPAPPLPAGGRAAWNSLHFSADELAQPAVSGPFADPDGDGLANLVEYALGLDPRDTDTMTRPVSGLSDGYWEFHYTRPAVRADVTYAVEASPDLATWSDQGVEHELVATEGETQTWRARRPQAGAATLFFRLRIAPIAP